MVLNVIIIQEVDIHLCMDILFLRMNDHFLHTDGLRLPVTSLYMELYIIKRYYKQPNDKSVIIES